MWPVGVDEYAEQVQLRLTDVAGIVVAGIPGRGKTSLLNAFIARTAPNPAVQYAILDGKDASDYDDVKQRVFAFTGDSLHDANQLLRRLVELRRGRAATIRDSLGAKNFWKAGPTDRWPLVVVIIDEAHTFFTDYKGTDQATKDLNALALENRRLVEDLVKKGRSVGLLTIVATQKSTGDSIPTQIRDVCSIALSFAQTTSAASVAALGESIREHPDADPQLLQGPEYVGVCSMRVEGRPGFTRVRIPLVDDDQVARVCREHAQLTRDPAELVPAARLSVVPDIA